MANIEPAEFQDMIFIAEETFNDLCNLIRSTGTTTDEYGEETTTTELLEDIPCGFSFSGAGMQISFKNEIGQAVILEGNAFLRVSLEQPISVRDSITVRGETYSVDGVYDGKSVRTVVLKSMDTSEAG